MHISPTNYYYYILFVLKLTLKLKFSRILIAVYSQNFTNTAVFLIIRIINFFTLLHFNKIKKLSPFQKIV